MPKPFEPAPKSIAELATDWGSSAMASVLEMMETPKPKVYSWKEHVGFTLLTLGCLVCLVAALIIGVSFIGPVSPQQAVAGGLKALVLSIL